MSSSAWSYDEIAEVYATDMGRSMPFDDVAWYGKLCTSAGRVLELGCGTGRILLELLAAGIDGFGVDRSLPMLARLRRDAQARGLAAPVAQMDLRALCLHSPFDLVLAPYSLITYLTNPAQASALLDELRHLLSPAGRIVIDAFVPQPVSSYTDFRLDYRRPHKAGSLERHKRITAQADGTNRIERRYRILDASGRLTDEFATDETIRPYPAEALIAMGTTAGLRCADTSWDYATRDSAEGARFVSLVFTAGGTA